MHDVRTADLTLLDRLTSVEKGRIETPVETDLKLYSRALHRSERSVGRRQVPVNRLLAKDMFTRLRCRLDEIGMRIPRRAD